MAKDGRLNVAIMGSTKERLARYCSEHDISQGDVVDAALKNYFERIDREYSSPDIVLDRMSQILMSQMQIAQTLGTIKDWTDRHDRD